VTVLEQAEKVLIRIRKAEAARGNLEVAHAFSELNAQLAQRSQRISAVAELYGLLKSKKVSVAKPTNLDLVEERLKGISTQFKEKPAVSTLKIGQRWTGLLASLDGLAGTADRQLHEAWKTYFATGLFAGLSPEVLRIRLAPTPKNKKSLSEYTQLYAKFIVYRDQIPESAERFEELQTISRKLGEISFDENVPKDVAAFLRATSSERGGELRLLPQSVLDWLTENELADKFAIRARIG
jgi:hypothetical protein